MRRRTRRDGGFWTVALALLATTTQLAAAHDLAVPPAGGNGAVAPVVGPAPGEAERRRLERNPNDVDAMGRLGHAYLEAARSEENPRFYALADSCFRRALAARDHDFLAIVGFGSLALSRHDFKGGIHWADLGLAQYPESAPLLAVLVDGNVELGRYEDAGKALEILLRVRPDLTAYSRAAYLRELYGDLDGAIEAMAAAAEAGVPGSEDVAWCRAQLGDLYFRSGRIGDAERTYRATDASRPGYPRALAGLARVASSRGDLATAELLYRAAIDASPAAAFRIELGDVYAAQGLEAQADEQYHLVRHAAEEARANGMNVDLEMALFEVEHGADPGQVTLVAEDAYLRRPSVIAAQVLAWTLYRAGRIDEAAPRIEEALRLGTRDPELFYRAGRIYQAAGDPAKAQRYLSESLRLNPKFSLRDAPAAEAALVSLAALPERAR